LGSRGEVDKSSNTAPSLIEVVARSRIEIRLDSKSRLRVPGRLRLPDSRRSAGKR
jgi:hypothetical protein